MTSEFGVSFLSFSPTWFRIPYSVGLEINTKTYQKLLNLQSISKLLSWRIIESVLTCNAAGCNGFWNTKPTGCGSAHLVGEFLSMMFWASWISLTTKSFNVVVLGRVQRFSLLPVNWLFILPKVVLLEVILLSEMPIYWLITPKQLCY